jgi:hypothetical protein
MIKNLVLAVITTATLAFGTTAMTGSAEARVLICHHHQCHVVRHPWHKWQHMNRWQHRHMWY